MKSFSRFLQESLILEYLTDTQRSIYSKTKMTPKARSSTDHFFGVGNDHVREEIKGQDEENKSEVHKKVEQHLGTNIDVDRYKKGVSKDKYGRDVKIGKTIKDENLRNEFAKDSTRAGVKSSHGHYSTIVRGTEVAGQTNSEPNAEHPKGHSWGQESCKNIVDGSNKKYLQHEVKHGSVVVRVHDNTDKEIYRATLQPHHNDEGHTSYHLNGEYGIKRSNFTKHANDVAKRLSGEHKSGSIAYTIHPKVYNDNNESMKLHPNATKEHFDLAMKDKDERVRHSIVKNPKATKEHLDMGIKDKDDGVRNAVVNHPNATKEHLDSGIKDKDEGVRYSVVKHPKATKEHLDMGIKDKDDGVRNAVVNHPNATKEHLDMGMKDENRYIRVSAVQHPNTTKEHLDLGMKDKDFLVRKATLENPNATKEHIDLGIKDQNLIVSDFAKKKTSEIGK